MAEASVFEGLQIEEDEEGMPKRIVAGRESIPNPFTDAVKASYDAWKADPAKAKSRSFTVPVDRKKVTLRTQVRKDKDGKVADVTQWEGHTNITSALYLLRQAAAKHNIGVRIVVDYTDKTVNGVAVPVKDKDGNITKNAKGETITETYDDVTRKTLVLKDGAVRIRFLGQEKKDTKKGDAAEETTSNEGVSTSAA